MSFYQRHALPHLLHFAMRQKNLVPFHRRVIGAAEGRVLEIGVGSGLNLPLYERTARTVMALEPSPKLLRLARERARTASIPIEFIEASAEAIPLDDRNVDTVVTTWTLCTIPDAPRALSQMRRGVEAGWRTTVRRARTRAGVRCRTLAGSARPAVVPPRGRLPSQPEDGRSDCRQRLPDRSPA
jgi:SAM-dependent methyltransferase